VVVHIRKTRHLRADTPNVTQRQPVDLLVDSSEGNLSWRLDEHSGLTVMVQGSCRRLMQVPDMAGLARRSIVENPMAFKLQVSQTSLKQTSFCDIQKRTLATGVIPFQDYLVPCLWVSKRGPLFTFWATAYWPCGTHRSPKTIVSRRRQHGRNKKYG
jgi:hypothetical protein